MNTAAPAHPPEIEALGNLASVEEMTAALGAIACGCGKVASVTALPAASEEDETGYAFLVAFTTAQEAMLAAERWCCQHFGITHVIVAVRRNNAGMERPGESLPRPAPDQGAPQWTSTAS